MRGFLPGLIQAGCATAPPASWKAEPSPRLDPTGRTLVIRYACDSFSFADAVHDLRIGRPRFLVATLE